MDTPSRPPLTHKERLDWLRLIRSENVGCVTFFRLLERFGSAAAALRALPEMARRGGRPGLRVCPEAEAAREMEALERLGARLIAWGEPDYPPLLVHVEDAPPLISVLGHPHLLAKRAVAVVGARNSSIVGRRMAETLARDLGAAGFVVVSGLARGIDTSAHAGALATGTVAVLASGLDVVYPPENRALQDSIVERGAVISEAPPGTQPLARNFPSRNRIISGISLGVVVVEASPRSGSLITARLALDQGREVFAVPGAALDPRARGTNHLIRQGATLTESAEDVIRVLDESSRRPLAERKRYELTAPAAPPAAPEELDSARRRIVGDMSPVPVTVDEIVRSCSFSPPVVWTVLLELELAGRLERHPGNRVSLIGLGW